MVVSIRNAALAASALLATSASAIAPITTKGSKFFAGDEQFFMKGVAYQQEASGSTKYVDPLADAAACKRDVPLLEKLDTNTIRVYAIDPTKDHSTCMNLLEQAGIYVVADLGQPGLSINRQDPKWDVELYDRYKAVVDDLGQYDNVIGFFAGNEVTNNNKNTPASAFVKAATRDTKAYIKSKMDSGHRWMGVGYAANDDASIRADMADYFNCGEQESAIDFWGYNIYSWCGESSYTESGYDVQVEFFQNFSVPVFFAEYGCNSPGGAANRKFDETIALYGDKMTPVFSGGIVYMYFQEANDYGLVKLNGDSASTMKDYDTLQTQIKKVSPSGVQSSAYSPTNSPASCPDVSKNWKVTGDALPPTPDSDLCTCMSQAATCAPSDSISDKSYGEIFGTICGDVPEACAGIKADPETGVYGPYSMCNPKDQLAAVLDAYYKDQGTDKACNFNGDAQIVKSPKTNSQCKSQLAQASQQAEVAATATQAPSSTATGGSGSNGDDTGAALSLRAASFSFGEMAMGAYVVAAMAAGAGMVFL